MKNKYKAKSLVPGHVISKEGFYIAVPEKVYQGGEFTAEWEGKTKSFKKDEAETYRVFKDKFKFGQMYTLGYFKWDGDTFEQHDKSVAQEGTE